MLQAILELVAECSAVLLIPVPGAVNDSPLKVALLSLTKMCAHSPCRHFLRSSKLLPIIIGQLRQSQEKEIAKYASDIIGIVADNA